MSPVEVPTSIRRSAPGEFGTVTLSSPVEVAVRTS